MRKGFTLLEMIFVVVIASVLSAGMFKALEALFVRSAKAKAMTELSMQSQIVLDQVSRLLYDRVPNSVIGFNVTSSSCEAIEDAVGDFQVLEWLSLDTNQSLQGTYSGFVDMNASSKPYLYTPNTDGLNISNRNLIFAGAFDGGSEDIAACYGAYGWHGKDSNLSYNIISSTTNTIELENTLINPAPDNIYEKYYISDGAYAVTRGEHVTDISRCNGLSKDNFKDFNNTLFLFYDFYPYNGDTYCGDGSGADPRGKVAILAENVVGFRAVNENDIIRISIDMEKHIRGSDNNVSISKQKAVF